MKQRWVGKISYRINGGPLVVFTGREPVVVADARYRRTLVEALGTIEELPGGRLRYIGRVTFAKKDGTKYEVDRDGIVDIDKALLPAKTAAKIDKELADIGGAP